MRLYQKISTVVDQRNRSKTHRPQLRGLLVGAAELAQLGLEEERQRLAKKKNRCERGSAAAMERSDRP